MSICSITHSQSFDNDVIIVLTVDNSIEEYDEGRSVAGRSSGVGLTDFLVRSSNIFDPPTTPFRRISWDNDTITGRSPHLAPFPWYPRPLPRSILYPPLYISRFLINNPLTFRIHHSSSYLSVKVISLLTAILHTVPVLDWTIFALSLCPLIYPITTSFSQQPTHPPPTLTRYSWPRSHGARAT